MPYWLMKSEPDEFSIQDLKKLGHGRWDGVRNYQARNFLRQMQEGDHFFFYHSSCAEPGIAGIVKVVKQGYPDHTAFDAGSKYFDADSDPSAPRWYMVDLQLVRRFAQPVTLDQLRRHADGKLKDMLILRRGNRLSVTPVSEAEWKFINGLAKQ